MLNFINPCRLDLGLWPLVSARHKKNAVTSLLVGLYTRRRVLRLNLSSSMTLWEIAAQSQPGRSTWSGRNRHFGISLDASCTAGLLAEGLFLPCNINSFFGNWPLMTYTSLEAASVKKPYNLKGRKTLRVHALQAVRPSSQDIRF